MNKELLVKSILKVAKTISAIVDDSDLYNEYQEKDQRPLCDRYDEAAKNAKKLSELARQPEAEGQVGDSDKFTQHSDAFHAHDKAQSILKKLQMHAYRAHRANYHMHSIKNRQSDGEELLNLHKEYQHLHSQHEKMKKIHSVGIEYHY